MTTREICKLCFHVNPIGFKVTNIVWKAVVPPKHQSDIVCISCFIRLADEKLIPWEKKITLFPLSLHTHLGLT